MSNGNINIPPQTETPSPEDMEDFIDNIKTETYRLQPTVVRDLEHNITYSIDADTVIKLNTSKEYIGGISSIEQPAYLLVKNMETDNTVAATNKFILTQWRESHIEKVQILETFKSSTLLWFGERTKTYAFAGHLIEARNTLPLLTYHHNNEFVDLEANAKDNDHIYLWGQSLRILWEKHLRGTKLVEGSNICVLTLMNNILYGYPFSLTLNSDASNPNVITFQFQFLCTKHITLNNKAQKLFETSQYKDRGEISTNVKRALNAINLQKAVVKDAIYRYELNPDINYNKTNLIEEGNVLKRMYTALRNGDYDNPVLTALVTYYPGEPDPSLE